MSAQVVLPAQKSANGREYSHRDADRNAPVLRPLTSPYVGVQHAAGIVLLLTNRDGVAVPWWAADWFEPVVIKNRRRTPAQMLAENRITPERAATLLAEMLRNAERRAA